MAKRRTIPGTDIGIGRGGKKKGGLTKRQQEERQGRIERGEEYPAKRTPEKPKRLYGTGDALDYVPFNIDNLPRNKAVRKIFKEYGYTSWRDLFVDWDYVHTDNLGNFRQSVYNTPEEVIKRFNSSILPYVKILYNYQTGMYHAFVNY